MPSLPRLLIGKDSFLRQPAISMPSSPDLFFFSRLKTLCLPHSRVRVEGKAAMASERTLEYTPTWAVAAVCTVIVIISLSVERVLHYLGKLLLRRKQKGLFNTLLKLKEELMLLGFISLLLTVFQNTISTICIPETISTKLLPCKGTPLTHHRINFGYVSTWNKRKLFSDEAGSDYCSSKVQGKVPLFSIEALHQLHIFIFVLAVVHVIFSAITMLFGKARCRQWHHWENAIQKEIREEAKSSEPLVHNHHHLEFTMERTAGYWRKFSVFRWMMCFFKQFHASITRSDYKALRAGFISKHCPSNPNFDFHKYVMRALEDDFRKVVGISWYLWLFVIVFLLLNMHGWHTYFWLSFLPFILLLLVGTKLEHIITKLAVKVADDANYSKEGSANVKPSDEHFWFGKPKFVLYLIRFILFQNSFEIAFFFWIWSTYGLGSCIIGSLGYLLPRLVIGVIIQVLCSYSTLPLYAIVTQMGDTFKRAIFAEHMQSTFQDWVSSVRSKKRPGFSAVLNLFDQKKKRKNSSADVQMQRMAYDGSESLSNIENYAVSQEIVASDSILEINPI